jgi:broad specificity phosphatase PhoE
MGVVIWARHGQNEANLSRTLSHRTYDRDLTELGRRQAEALGEGLAGSFAAGAGTGAAGRVALVATSPLKRARQTAEIVAARLGLPVDPVLEDLREVNVGSLDGRADPQAWESYEQVLAAWQHGDRQVRFPDGEDLDELCLRLRRAVTEVDRLAAASGVTGTAGGSGTAGGVGLIVAHAGNLRAALSALTGAPEPDADLPTGGYATLRVTPEPEPGSGGAGARLELLTWSTPR